ncbi:MAG: preprotein translocase subunit YajC [Mariprofundus sp.]|nr:preprotein translocase subunit YajC [Mariprofundus sp.]
MTSPSISLSPITTVIASAVAAMAIINPAFAEAATGGSGGFASLIPLVLIMVIFYFLLIRPQQKKLKEHRNLVDELKKGDNILTGGGLYGKVIDVKEDILKVEIADGVRINVKRDTIAGLTDIGPAKEKASKGKPAKKAKPVKATPAAVTEEKVAESSDADLTDSKDKA